MSTRKYGRIPYEHLHWVRNPRPGQRGLPGRWRRARQDLDPSNDHQWLVEFATKEAKLSGTTSFNFQVYVGNSDSANPATVQIG